MSLYQTFLGVRHAFLKNLLRTCARRLARTDLTLSAVLIAHQAMFNVS